MLKAKDQGHKRKCSQKKKDLTNFSGVLHKIRSRIKFGRGYFAPRGKVATCYLAIWRQNSPNSYFAASAKIARRLI